MRYPCCRFLFLIMASLHYLLARIFAWQDILRWRNPGSHSVSWLVYLSASHSFWWIVDLRTPSLVVSSTQLSPTFACRNHISHLCHLMLCNKTHLISHYYRFLSLRAFMYVCMCIYVCVCMCICVSVHEIPFESTNCCFTCSSIICSVGYSHKLWVVLAHPSVMQHSLDPN